MLKSDMQIINQSLGKSIALKVSIADSYWTRLRGWMFCPKPEAEQGLYLCSCKGVHTWGMRFAILAVYIDFSGKVLDVVTLQPWRIGPWHWHCRGVLELPLNDQNLEKCRPGDQLGQIYGNGW